MKTGPSLLAAAALSLAACSPVTSGDIGQAPPPAASGETTPTQAMPYVAMAGASDLYEIQSSQLHHRRGESPALHRFAQMMIEHHAQTTAATTAAARSAGMNPPPPELMPMQRDMIARLQGLNGAAFDREYRTQQIAAHRMALTLHSNYASSGDTPSLKTSASSAVPIVQQHLTEIEGMTL